MQIYEPNSYTTEKQNHFLMFMKNYKLNDPKMVLNMKNVNNFTQCDRSRCDVHVRDHTPKAPRAVWAQYVECIGHFQYTPRIY